MVSSANGGNAKHIRVNDDNTGMKRTNRSLADNTPNNVIRVLIASRQTLKAFGKAY